jgi:hypothetical protein
MVPMDEPGKPPAPAPPSDPAASAGHVRESEWTPVLVVATAIMVATSVTVFWLLGGAREAASWVLFLVVAMAGDRWIRRVRSRTAKVSRGAIVLGLGMMLYGLVAIGAGAFETFAASERFSGAERQRILSNGIAETTYMVMFTALFAIPFLLAGWWLGRRASKKLP